MKNWVETRGQLSSFSWQNCRRIRCNTLSWLKLITGSVVHLVRPGRAANNCPYGNGRAYIVRISIRPTIYQHLNGFIGIKWNCAFGRRMVDDSFRIYILTGNRIINNNNTQFFTRLMSKKFIESQTCINLRCHDDALEFLLGPALRWQCWNDETYAVGLLYNLFRMQHNTV
jgi:hypothetical protein